MKKVMMIMALAVGLSVVAVSQAEANCGNCAAGDNKPKLKTENVKEQTTCPVMGGKIDKKQYADVKGKRIYVCCPGCIGKIKADPDKYIKKLESEGVTLDSVPASADKHAELKH